jgi:hypothetical protein
MHSPVIPSPPPPPHPREAVAHQQPRVPVAQRGVRGGEDEPGDEEPEERAVAVQVDPFESISLKPVFHCIGSRFEIRPFKLWVN